jgi:hypothetical protein
MKRENRGKVVLASGGVVGGIGVLALASLAHTPFIALGLGALILYGGWKLFQKPNAFFAGVIAMAAGVLTAASAVPLVGGLASLLLNVSGIALLGGGIWTLFKVFRDRK